MTICKRFRDNLNKNLKHLAKEEVFTVNRWFRNKYKLSPKDPAFLSCEQWEIELEYMTDEMERELSKIGSFCSKCGERIEDGLTFCKRCGKSGVIEQYTDPDFNDYFDVTEKENEGINDELKNMKWEEVPDTENK